MQDCRKSEEPKRQGAAALPPACSTLPFPGLAAVPTITAFLHSPVTRDFFCITTIKNTHTEPSVASAMEAASNFFISHELLYFWPPPPQNPNPLPDTGLIVQCCIFKDYLNSFWREILLHSLLSRKETFWESAKQFDFKELLSLYRF